jgi:hypothetical protein
MTAYLYDLGRQRPFFDQSDLDPAFSSPHFRPTLFPDLFGPVADIPHIGGIRGMPAFVFLTCVVSKTRREIHNS